MALIKLENEAGRVLVAQHAGATLRSLQVRIGSAWHELLVGGDSDSLDAAITPSGVGSFIMAPWVNRIYQGLLVTEHGEFQLPLDSGVHAIHGIVRRREWQLVSMDAKSAVFEIELQKPWPFGGRVVYRIGLDGPSLRQTLEVHAAGGERQFPAGVGWHPYFKRSLGSDELMVQAKARAEWELDDRIVPSGEIFETAATRKLQAGGWFEVGEVDGCFQVEPGAPINVRWPELTLRMVSSPEVSHAMIYSPVSAICVEPQTSTVNAFQLAASGASDTGTILVLPHKPLIASTTWSWSAN